MGEAAYEIGLHGDVDLHAAGELGVELLDLVAARAGDVALDLSDVDLIDSTTLALLLRTSRLLSSAGGRLRVVGASPHARRLLELASRDGELALEEAPA